MIDRRQLSLGLPVVALAGVAQCPCTARGRVYRIGMLETIPAEMNRPQLDAFRKGMSERGFAEARDYVLEYRSADGPAEHFQTHAAELVRAKVDLIVTRGTPAALAAKAATATISIVMAAVGEPTRVVASLTNPGGNVTGLTSRRSS